MSLFQRIITRNLNHHITKGHLILQFPNGQMESFGDHKLPLVKIAIQSNKWLRSIFINPDLQLGEAYMEGGLVIEQGSLYQLLDLCWQNRLVDPNNGKTPISFLRMMARSIHQFNSERKAKKNIACHYDIGNQLYSLFLDEDMQYSCAYYKDDTVSLGEAQRLKKEHIAKKLNLRTGDKVLDIGCGWGGMAMHLAKQSGVKVDGITLSHEQLALAKKRAKQAGLDHIVHFALQDYRHLSKRYDRIVSVGMLEHVGVPHFREYFQQIARLLDDDGVALIHTIGRTDGPGATNPWIDRHIFPGGYIPALSELLPHIEKAGLQILDIEILRLHYAETLKDWRRNVDKNRDKIIALNDERFLRMWEFYLICSELSFRYGVHNVLQLQLAKKQDAVPLTRDYLYENTAAYEPIPQNLNHIHSAENGYAL